MVDHAAGIDAHCLGLPVKELTAYRAAWVTESALCRYCCKKIFHISMRNIDSRNGSVAQD
jgi:hypothetical protein